MEAHVNEVRRHVFEVGPATGRVGDAKCDVVLPEKGHERRVAKRLVPHFHGVANGSIVANGKERRMPEPTIAVLRESRRLRRRPRQDAEEVFEALPIERELRGQLPEDRAELFGQRQNARTEEVGERRAAIAKLWTARARESSRRGRRGRGVLFQSREGNRAPKPSYLCALCALCGQSPTLFDAAGPRQRRIRTGRAERIR